MKTYVITGASDGIGLHCATQLAATDTRLVLVGRNPDKLQHAAKQARVAGARAVDTLECDYSNLASVRALAQRVLTDYEHIDVLVNNAGSVFASRTLTVDGYESTWQVNHLAGYLLTESLKARMVSSAPSRIVMTASTAHYRGTMDFGDLGYQHGYSVTKAYSRSKLANVLYARSLAAELAGTGVTVNALHPGMVATDIWDRAPWFARPALAVVKRYRMITPAQGGARIAYLAAEPELEQTTGAYFEDDRITAPSQVALDDTIAMRLRHISDRLVGLAP